MGVTKNQCYKLNKNGKRCKLKCMEDCDSCHIHRVTYYEDDDYLYDLIEDMQNDIQSIEEKLRHMQKKMNETVKDFSSKLFYYKLLTLFLCTTNTYMLMNNTNCYDFIDGTSLYEFLNNKINLKSFFINRFM